ncbi:MAG: beta-ketoacyl-[acyl-carrier-protein] synthase II, partial [Candidatus Dormibacteraeota bacterium]|nr:beta-ketoacyl-[acyl-carrier-protein] synthase II [Candidatus Dormibacteraeota bacterium]
VKSMTGHLLGAAGALESLACVMALRSKTAPPTINLTDPDPECALNHLTQATAIGAGMALNNSFGFGGHNATLVFGDYAAGGA